MLRLYFAFNFIVDVIEFERRKCIKRKNVEIQFKDILSVLNPTSVIFFQSGDQVFHMIINIF